METCSGGTGRGGHPGSSATFEAGTWAGADRRDRAAAMVAMSSFFESRYEELAATLEAEAGASLAMLSSAQLRQPITQIGQTATCTCRSPRPNTPRVPSRR